MLIICGVSRKLLNGIKSNYVDSEAYVRINGSESEWFTIDSRMRQGCVISPLFFHLYTDLVMKDLMVGITGEGVRMVGSGGYIVYCMLLI